MHTHQSILLQNVSVIREGRSLLQDVSLTLNPGEQWAITGPAGSGKTVLTLCIAGEMQFSGTLVKPEGLRLQRLSQQHQFLTRSHTRDFYYQQRYQSSDAEDALTIREALASLLEEGVDTTLFYIEQLHLTASLDKPMIQLSNGENKRLQLVTALVRKPDLLILDNPFTGLDREGRVQLHSSLNRLAEQGCRLLIICPANELPDCITHVIQLQEGRVRYSGERNSAPPMAAVSAPAIHTLPPPEYPPFA
jgi:molybdate transport system ATP-binding protein